MSQQPQNITSGEARGWTPTKKRFPFYVLTAEWLLLSAEDLRYYSSPPHTPPTPSLWARALSLLPSRALLLPKPARGGHRSARRSPPSPLHFSQHGYSCNLDPLHRRIPAVRGTRKVSDRHHHLSTSASAAALVAFSLCMCACLCVCLHVCLLLPLWAARLLQCWQGQERGCQKKKKKKKQTRGEKEKPTSAAISLLAGSC